MSQHAPGTLYSNSIRKVIATDRANEFGDTIFFNEGTGQECVVIGGQLYGTEIAGKIHADLVTRAAPELLAALRAVYGEMEKGFLLMPSALCQEQRDEVRAIVERAAKAIEKAEG